MKFDFPKHKFNRLRAKMEKRKSDTTTTQWQTLNSARNRRRGRRSIGKRAMNTEYSIITDWKLSKRWSEMNEEGRGCEFTTFPNNIFKFTIWREGWEENSKIIEKNFSIILKNSRNLTIWKLFNLIRFPSLPLYELKQYNQIHQ